MIKKAMILAAGFGKRLNPLTINCPKPLLKIENQTLLSNTLKFLKLFGIKKVIINVHYLKNQIIDYVNKNNFDLDIILIEEKDKILDTGGGILNAIKYFSETPFLVINPDTIWNHFYIKELKKLEEDFFLNKKNQCSLLVVNKDKSFDKSFKGDFNLENNLINRKKDSLKYIYTGLQIIKPEVFDNLNSKVFSINNIWDNLISNNKLIGMESIIDFYHVSTLDVYNKIQKKNLDIK